MTENYELLYIISANYTAEEINPIISKVKALLAEHGAQIVKEENLGKQKLAYPIKKNSHGYYILNLIKMDKKEILPLNNVLNITTDVIRFLITTYKEKSQKEIDLEKKLKDKITKEKEIEIEKIQSEKKEVPVKKEAPVKVSAEELDKKLDEILKGEDII